MPYLHLYAQAYLTTSFMRYFLLFLSVLFVVFGLVQLNDPDPWLWLLLYLYVAAIFVLAFRQQFYRWLGLGGLVVVVGWALTLVPAIVDWIQMGMPTITGSMKAEAPHIELAREFFGLVLCGIALGWYTWRAFRPSSTS